MLRIFSRLAARILPVLIAGVLLTQPAAADFIQQGPKVIGDGASGASNQGYSVAISADGNTAIVGGPYDADNMGAAWIFVRSNGAWTPQSGKLVGGNAAGGARQGRSVALSADGNTAILGGPTDDGGNGAVWVFVRNNGAWLPQGGKLLANGAMGAANFGNAVALSMDGNTAIVGGYLDNGDVGAAWIFTRSGGTWAQRGNKLVGANPMGASNQGRAVALSGDGTTALIGGHSDNNNTGAAWVFVRSSGTWSQFGNKLIGTGSVGRASQGFSVALSSDGKTAAVGGYVDAGDIGATWIYTFNGTSWTQQQKLVGTGSVGNAHQGSSVSLSSNGDTLLTGAYGDNSSRGAAWVFTRNNGAWSQLGSKLVGSGFAGDPQQGLSAALSADASTAIVGGFGNNGEVGASWIWLRRTPHDFNGNGKSDILWRNTSGEAGMWFMSGGSIASAPGLGVVSNNWSIVGQRDFNGDGKNDLLWLDTAGNVGIWFMNGGTVLSTSALGNVGTSWKVVGTGDFDGDGKADILWRETSGAVGVWLMNGSTVDSTVALGNPGTAWSVMGTADFDGDGRSDILWRSTSHDIGAWFMFRGSVRTTALLANVGPAWSVAGLGDFDADGNGDILWRSTSNDVGLWLMNGRNIAATPGLGNVGASWQVASVGDYTGDGKADILWRSTSHDIGIWFMNGGTLLSTSLLGNVDPTWLVQNAASN